MCGFNPFQKYSNSNISRETQKRVKHQQKYLKQTQYSGNTTWACFSTVQIPKQPIPASDLLFYAYG